MTSLGPTAPAPIAKILETLFFAEDLHAQSAAQSVLFLRQENCFQDL